MNNEQSYFAGMTDIMCVALKRAGSILCSKYWYSGIIFVNATNLSFFFVAAQEEHLMELLNS